MSRPNLYGGLISGALIDRLRVRTPPNVALGGDTILTNRSAPVQVLDPGGTHRDVELPAEEAHLVFIIVNSASSTENLVIKNDSGTSILTLTGLSGGG